MKTTEERRHPLYFFLRVVCCLAVFFIASACETPEKTVSTKTSEEPTIKENPQTLEDLDQSMYLLHKVDQKAAQKVHPSIYKAKGFGNSFLVTTKQGNVIIDTGLIFEAKKQKKLLSEISDAPAKAIFITHAHGDHTGGIGLWKEKDTRVIMHQNSRNQGTFYRRSLLCILSQHLYPSGYQAPICAGLCPVHRQASTSWGGNPVAKPRRTDIGG